MHLRHPVHNACLCKQITDAISQNSAVHFWNSMNLVGSRLLRNLTQEACWGPLINNRPIFCTHVYHYIYIFCIHLYKNVYMYLPVGHIKVLLQTHVYIYIYIYICICICILYTYIHLPVPHSEIFCCQFVEEQCRGS